MFLLVPLLPASSQGCSSVFDPIGTCFPWQFQVLETVDPHRDLFSTCEKAFHPTSVLPYLNVCLFTKLICWNCCCSIWMPTDMCPCLEVCLGYFWNVLPLSHISPYISGIILMSNSEWIWQHLFETILLKKKIAPALHSPRRNISARSVCFKRQSTYNLPVWWRSAISR